jgi:hypothetical protein
MPGEELLKQEFWKQPLAAFQNDFWVMLPLFVIVVLAVWWFRGRLSEAQIAGLRAEKSVLEQRLNLAADQAKIASQVENEVERQLQALNLAVTDKASLSALAMLETEIGKLANANNAVSATLSGVTRSNVIVSTEVIRADTPTTSISINSLSHDRARLEFIFDESDPRCVKDEFYWYNDKPPKSRSWFVGIKNSSTTKSADDVTIRAHESWFVGNTISEVHRRIDESLKKSPLIFSRATLEPGAVEFIELFGQGPNPTTLPGNVFKIGHDFVLEARARDAQTVLMTLRYEPTEPFAMIKRL